MYILIKKRDENKKKRLKKIEDYRQYKNLKPIREMCTK